MSGRHEPKSLKTISRQTRARLGAWCEDGLITREQYEMAVQDEHFRRCLIMLAENRQDPERKRWIMLLGCNISKWDIITTMKTARSKKGRKEEPEPRFGKEVITGQQCHIPMAGARRTMIPVSA